MIDDSFKDDSANIRYEIKELERKGKILKKKNLLKNEFKDLNNSEFPKKHLNIKNN